MRNHKQKLLAITLLLFNLGISQTSIASDDELTVGTFSQAEMSEWKERTFEGKTIYKPMTEGKYSILKASCDGTASALYRDIKIDLIKTPILKWSWKINNIHEGLNDISKTGDDYAARVYVIYKDGIFPWNVKALNYVWANTQPTGSSWPNAFSNKAMMVAQRSGSPKNREDWQHESRNIRNDFIQYFGIGITEIDGIAIMTDCDNANGKATSYYRNIRFTKN